MSESNSKPITISLKWRDPDTGEEELRQANLPAVLGRHPDSDIYIEHPNLSRKHLSIMQEGFDIVVKDEKSGNGTILNGDRIEKGTLTNGDVLRLGTLELEVSLPNLESLRRLQLAQNKTVVLDLDGPLVDEKPSKAAPPPPRQVNGSETIPPLAPAGFRAAPPVENGGTIVWDEDEDEISDVGEVADRVPIENRTIVFDPDDDSLKPLFNRQVEKAKFPPAWFNQEMVSVRRIESSGYQVDEATYLAIGGGLGSFIWIDNLLIYGVPREEIMSIGFEPKPYGRYRRLCGNSQIPDRERLRSNSDSTPDNVWGWPGYAPREIFRDFRNGNLKNAFRVTWQILAEPVYSDTYTPISGNVFDSIDREAERIEWDQIWRRGSVRAIRKTDDGRYAIAYAQKDRQGNSTYKFALANFVHLAVGYPGIRLLNNLQEYRRRTGDFKKIVNAYEVHDHIYKQLERKKGVVLIRGRGIVASRIIQRIFETRQIGGNVQVIHLMRSPKPEGSRNGFSQRVVDNHWEFQPFNWPKAAWSGIQRIQLEAAPPGTRKQLLSGDSWGGTTTADRDDWRQMVATGLAEGWYEIRFASIKGVDSKGDKVAVAIESQHTQTTLDADFVIDATGLESGIDAHPLLKDLLDQYDLKRNVQGRLEVTNDFEIAGMRHQNGRMFAAGVITLGGPYAPVDSFLGLQYSAQRAIEFLRKQRAPGIRRLRGLRSVIQWTKWARGVKP
ncbi:MAG: FHA domain-containing protein [Chloroflexota bacterium]